MVVHNNNIPQCSICHPLLLSLDFLPFDRNVGGGGNGNKGSDKFHHVSLLDDICRRDGARLAVPGSTNQLENIVKFLVEEEPTWMTAPEEPAASSLFLGFRTDAENVSVSARQFAPYPAAQSFEDVDANRPPVALATDSEGTSGKCYLLTKSAGEEKRLNGSECGFRSGENVGGLCHYKACQTAEKKNCIFPFRYTLDKRCCTKISLDNLFIISWCPGTRDARTTPASPLETGESPGVRRRWTRRATTSRVSARHAAQSVKSTTVPSGFTGNLDKSVM